MEILSLSVTLAAGSFQEEEMATGISLAFIAIAAVFALAVSVTATGEDSYPWSHEALRSSESRHSAGLLSPLNGAGPWLSRDGRSRCRRGR